MSIIYPELSQVGRLGNQMWEIASTIGIARKVGQQPAFPKWDYQEFFSLPEEFFVDEPHGRHATDFVRYMDPRARHYLQDYNLFKDIEDEIRAYFQPSPKAKRKLNKIWKEQFADLDGPILSIHVRRGDNTTHPQGYHPLRSMDYYRHGVNRLKSLGMLESIAVFSDDPEWCRWNIPDAIDHGVNLFYEGTARPREYVDRVAYESAPVLDWVDLQLMARCNYHIISNSTYAWWGAFLSSDPHPMKPSNWFGRHISGWTDASLMFPPHWWELPDPTQGGI